VDSDSEGSYLFDDPDSLDMILDGFEEEVGVDTKVQEIAETASEGCLPERSLQDCQPSGTTLESQLGECGEGQPGDMDWFLGFDERLVEGHSGPTENQRELRCLVDRISTKGAEQKFRHLLTWIKAKVPVPPDDYMFVEDALSKIANELGNDTYRSRNSERDWKPTKPGEENPWVEKRQKAEVLEKCARHWVDYLYKAKKPEDIGMPQGVDSEEIDLSGLVDDEPDLSGVDFLN